MGLGRKRVRRRLGLLELVRRPEGVERSGLVGESCWTGDDKCGLVGLVEGRGFSPLWLLCGNLRLGIM